MCMYIYIYLYAGCRVNKWSTFCPLLGQSLSTFSCLFYLLLSAGRMKFLKKKQSFKKTKLKQKSRANKWSTCASISSKQNVDHLLTLPWTTYWPYFLRPKLAKPLFYSAFRKHTYNHQNPKDKSTIISRVANITAPFDSDRKSFHFLAPFFCFFPLPLAYLTT